MEGEGIATDGWVYEEPGSCFDAGRSGAWSKCMFASAGEKLRVAAPSRQVAVQRCGDSSIHCRLRSSINLYNLSARRHDTYICIQTNGQMGGEMPTGVQEAHRLDARRQTGR